MESSRVGQLSSSPSSRRLGFSRNVALKELKGKSISMRNIDGAILEKGQIILDTESKDEDNADNLTDSRKKLLERQISEAKLFAKAIGENDETKCMPIIMEDTYESFDEDEDFPLSSSEHSSTKIGLMNSFIGEYQHNHSGHNNVSDNILPPSYFQHRLPHTSTHDEKYLEMKNTSQSDVQPSDISDMLGVKESDLEITEHGISRGNYAQLHRKAWLEVSDKHHRYGTKLGIYYKHWESIGHPYNAFFDWLDSENEAAGNELPELEECKRADLDSDIVRYINDPEILKQYLVTIEPESDDQPAKLYGYNNEPICTGKGGFIFVLRDHKLYGAKKITSLSGKNKQRFHHSTFFSGKAVAAAGIFITDDDGHLKKIFPHSGHYRPGEAHMQRILFHLFQSGVDLDSVKVDMQQIMCVSRESRDAATPKGGDGNKAGVSKGDEEKKKVKQKKSDLVLMLPGLYVAQFLAHKALMIEEGLFSQIHEIKQFQGKSVEEILRYVDQGGVYSK